ncbi:MAG: glycosyltransferase [Eubacterium sp.]|nr:glycosyltransferase [Eubacterium sp.]
MKKISIIVPVHNSVDFLPECWNSLKTQTMGTADLEFIFVDDASTDGGATVEMIRGFREECPDSVKVIELEHNLRQGGARNAGMEVATGEFIEFVDSDDMLTPNACEFLYNKAVESGADIVEFNNYNVMDDGTAELSVKVEEAAFYEIDDSNRSQFLALGVLDCGCWNKLYRHDFVKEVGSRYAEHKVYEEPLFVFPLILRARRVCLCEEALYKWMYRDSGTTVAEGGKRLVDNVDVQEALMDYLQGFGDDFRKYYREIEKYFAVFYYSLTLRNAAIDANADFTYEDFNRMNARMRRLFPDIAGNPYLKNADVTTEVSLGFIRKDAASQGELHEMLDGLRAVIEKRLTTFIVAVRNVAGGDAERLIDSLSDQSVGRVAIKSVIIDGGAPLNVDEIGEDDYVIFADSSMIFARDAIEQLDDIIKRSHADALQYVVSGVGRGFLNHRRDRACAKGWDRYDLFGRDGLNALLSGRALDERATGKVIRGGALRRLAGLSANADGGWGRWSLSDYVNLRGVCVTAADLAYKVVPPAGRREQGPADPQAAIDMINDAMNELGALMDYPAVRGGCMEALEYHFIKKVTGEITDCVLALDEAVAFELVKFVGDTVRAVFPNWLANNLIYKEGRELMDALRLYAISFEDAAKMMEYVREKGLDARELPGVSVVIPTHERPVKLREAVESIAIQTLGKLEIIMVDDASNDNTPEAAQALVEEYTALGYDIRYIRNEKNMGTSYTKNAGIRVAKYDYVAYCDDDDLCRADKLEKQLRALLKEPEAGFCYCEAVYHLVESDAPGFIPDRRLPSYRKEGYIYPQLLPKNIVEGPTMMYRREVLEEAGLFAEDLRVFEDWDLALRLSENRPVVFVDEPLYDYYQSVLSLAHYTDKSQMTSANDSIDRFYAKYAEVKKTYGLKPSVRT